MTGFSKAPAFRANRWGDIITELAVPLIGMRHIGEELPSGTAFFIAPGLAITASHVILDYLQQYDDRVTWNGNAQSSFGLLSFQVLDGGQTLLPLRVLRVWFSDPLDIAFLHMAPAAERDPARRWKVPILELLPPNEGERVSAFGYPGSTLTIDAEGHRTLKQSPSTAVGEVVEVFRENRDRALLPYPCFRTNSRFASGMSGGPVFNDRGAICGVVCSSVDFTETEEGHVSYASTLWPSMATLIDMHWEERYPKGTFYPVLELVKAGLVSAHHADRLTLSTDGQGKRTVAMHDERGVRLGVESISRTV
jgi:hypothetical protein